MSEQTGIEWCTATWPIVQGCDPVSPGCIHCYAVPLLNRLAHNPNVAISGPIQGLVERYTPASGESILRFTGRVALRHDRLDWPMKWAKPAMIFVPSHGDLFHKDVPDAFVIEVYARMALNRHHIFQVLTKRAARMQELLGRTSFIEEVYARAAKLDLRVCDTWRWPLPNVWCGVSVEDQARANERIPLLLDTPARIRFLSCEPLLERIDIAFARGQWVGWVICGGESGGRKARMMDPDWARALRDQCAHAGIAFFMKQMTNRATIPPDLYVRQFPRR